jgi:hypothetical protein
LSLNFLKLPHLYIFSTSFEGFVSQPGALYWFGMATQLCSSGIFADQPATYRIRVQGRIKASWSDRFEGMTITSDPSPQAPPVTILVGTLSDQAALVGVFNSLHELRLAILSVECLSGQRADVTSTSGNQ